MWGIYDSETRCLHCRSDGETSPNVPTSLHIAGKSNIHLVRLPLPGMEVHLSEEVGGVVTCGPFVAGMLGGRGGGTGTVLAAPTGMLGGGGGCTGTVPAIATGMLVGGAGCTTPLPAGTPGIVDGVDGGGGAKAAAAFMAAGEAVLPRLPLGPPQSECNVAETDAEQSGTSSSSSSGSAWSGSLMHVRSGYEGIEPPSHSSVA